jgi:hypothetical protein
MSKKHGICALLLRRLGLEQPKLSLGRARLAESHPNTPKGVMQQFLLIEVFPRQILPILIDRGRRPRTITNFYRSHAAGLGKHEQNS